MPVRDTQTHTHIDRQTRLKIMPFRFAIGPTDRRDRQLSNSIGRNVFTNGRPKTVYTQRQFCSSRSACMLYLQAIGMCDKRWHDLPPWRQILRFRRVYSELRVN